MVYLVSIFDTLQIYVCSQFVSDLVGYPKGSFSCDAQFISQININMELCIDTYQINPVEQRTNQHTCKNRTKNISIFYSCPVTDQNKLSLMSVFTIMLNFQSLVDYLKKISKTNKKSNSTQVRQQYLRCNYAKFQLKILNFQRVPSFCRFYYRNDRGRNDAFTEMCEALLRRNISATSLKISCTNR